VVIRKNWGGNRTENGARVQAVLTSVLCTARQQDKDVFALLTDLLRSPQPKLLDLLPASVAGSEVTAASGGQPTEAGTPEPGLVFPEWLPAAEAVPIFSSA
jgi:hypothetical protein